MNQRCTRELLTRECDGLQSDRGRRILPPHAQSAGDASRRRGWSWGALGRRPEKARRFCRDCSPALCSRPHALEWWHLGMAEWRPFSGWRWRSMISFSAAETSSTSVGKRIPQSSTFFGSVDAPFSTLATTSEADSSSVAWSTWHEMSRSGLPKPQIFLVLIFKEVWLRVGGGGSVGWQWLRRRLWTRPRVFRTAASEGESRGTWSEAPRRGAPRPRDKFGSTLCAAQNRSRAGLVRASLVTRRPRTRQPRTR